MKSGGAIKNRPISELLDFDDEDSLCAYPISRDFQEHDDFRESFTGATPDVETFRMEGEEIPQRVVVSQHVQQMGLWQRRQCMLLLSIALVVSIVVTSVELIRMGPGFNTLNDASDATDDLKRERLKSWSTGT